MTNHSKLIQTRRKKQRTAKALSIAAKHAKKAEMQKAKKAGAGAR